MQDIPDGPGIAVPDAAFAPPAVADLALRDGLLAAIPPLRAFALGLTGDPGRADDLVQDTLLRAWTGAVALPHGPDLTARLIAALRDRA